MSKIGKFYEENGLSGLFLRGAKKIIRSTGKLLIHTADRLPIQWTLSSRDRLIIKKNVLFKDKHKGQRCFVIGDGPSLKKQDISPLNNEITFVMTGFWKHPIVKQWQPDYYFLADPCFFDGSGPMQHFFINVCSYIHKSNFFVPLSGRSIIQQLSLLPLDHTYYVAINGSLSNSVVNCFDFTRNVPGVMSVSQFAIMAAIYMGCSPIYLLGLDHDWLAHRGMDRHFYDGNIVQGHPLATGDLDRYSYKFEMTNVLELWNGYERIKDIATQCGIEIKNATRGGFLDVFPRVEYETLFHSTN